MIHRFCLLAGLLLGALATRAQQTITGTVVEAQTGQPVPFATVELRRFQAGAQGNAAGAFSLPLPAAPGPADSLVVSALGYGPRRVPVPVAGALQVPLVAQPVALGAVVVRPGRGVVLGPTGRGHRLGYAYKCSGPGASSRGYQLARFFAPGAAGYIAQVGFLLGNGLIETLGTPCDGKALSQAPFRVRLYAADGPGGAPGTDLLTETLLTAPAGEGWHRVDLARFAIKIPPAGFFVALEWVYTDDRFLCRYETTGPNKQPLPTSRYGQVLQGIREETNLAWAFAAGRGWYALPAYQNVVHNPAIQATVATD